MQTAKVKVQQLQNVMGILGDPEKREVYDQTGSINAGAIGLSSLSFSSSNVSQDTFLNVF